MYMIKKIEILLIDHCRLLPKEEADSESQRKADKADKMDKNGQKWTRIWQNLDKNAPIVHQKICTKTSVKALFYPAFFDRLYAGV